MLKYKNVCVKFVAISQYLQKLDTVILIFGVRMNSYTSVLLMIIVIYGIFVNMWEDITWKRLK